MDSKKQHFFPLPGIDSTPPLSKKGSSWVEISEGSRMTETGTKRKAQVKERY